jgi:hypothetical protein
MSKLIDGQQTAYQIERVAKVRDRFLISSTDSRYRYRPMVSIPGSSV